MTRYHTLFLIGCLLLAGVACRAGSGSRTGGDAPDSPPLPTAAAPAEAPAGAAEGDPLPTLFPTATAPVQPEAPAPSQPAAPTVTPTSTATPEMAETPDNSTLSGGDALLDLLDALATANAAADDLSDIDELDP